MLVSLAIPLSLLKRRDLVVRPRLSTAACFNTITLQVYIYPAMLVHQGVVLQI